MYGKVVTKHARHNLCFADFNQEPNYAEGRGTVVKFDDVPTLRTVREKLQTYLGEDDNLFAEGNLYYDVKKCYIGEHGDGERRKVIALRLGEPLPLFYRWFYQCDPVSRKIKFVLNPGDLYIMSDYATGHNWKKKNVATLRHS